MEIDHRGASHQDKPPTDRDRASTTSPPGHIGNDMKGYILKQNPQCFLKPNTRDLNLSLVSETPAFVCSVPVPDADAEAFW